MAKNKAREITQLTLKRLHSLSGNRCAFPGCSQQFFKVDSKANISNICHIEAAEAGGKRYNPDSDDDYRRSFKNLILLCPNHHTEIDNTDKYTVADIQAMKKKHEEKFQNFERNIDLISRHPSAINTVIKSISENIFDEMYEDKSYSLPDTEKKILHNNVVKYKGIIDEYKVFQGKLKKIYEEIEKQGSLRKELLLLNIKTIYLEEKKNYESFEHIRSCADDIIDNVKNRLLNIIERSNNPNTELPFEAIEIGLYVVMVDAFIACKILEEPPI